MSTTVAERKTSVLQTVENAYLSILRLVIIVVSSLLLIAAMFFAVSAIEHFWPPLIKARTDTPAVQADDVLKRLTPTKAELGKTVAETHQAGKKQDSNEIFYRRIIQAVSGFVRTYSKDSLSGDADRLHKLLEDQPTQYKDDKTITAYLSGCNRRSSATLTVFT